MLMFIIIQLYLIALGSLVFSGVKIARAYKHHRFSARKTRLTDKALPTVSVCLPARNETNAMTGCLESVLASDYPKLEVIVLDDDSSDNTSNLIKAFAHSGVRFVPGDPLPDDWLGKNYSLETLLDEASGHYVLFMDVDTRLKPNTIRSLVEHMSRSHKQMISVIPQRHDMYRASAWLSSLRYFWEMVLPEKTRPGSSSAAWMVERRFLSDELGGFGIWRDDVLPEMYIARELTKTDGYQWLVSTPELGVTFEKKWSSQVETSRRLLLPRFNNSFFSVFVGVGLLLSIVLPQFLLVLSILEGWWPLFWAGASLVVAMMLLYMLYCRLVWSRRWWLGFILAPYIAWQEVWLMLSSAVGYHLGTITWKGRPVARPVPKKPLV